MESKVAKNTSTYRNFSISVLENTTGIKKLLQQQLLTAIGLFTINSDSVDLFDTAELMLGAIPVQRLADDTCVVYRSPIALKLAPLWQLNALDLAHQLTVSFPTISQDIASEQCLDFNLEVVSPGWINFRLSDSALATWLQHMIQSPSYEWEEEQGRGGAGQRERKMIDKYSNALDVSDLFPVQYAHARCCSLLRSAHRQGLIKLSNLDFNTQGWQFVEPNPIPWLNDEQGASTEQRSLRLVHLAERRLISQLLDWQDERDESSLSRSVKRCSSLSNDFEQFYSSCRIWGEVKTENPKLAQARLGLVGVTQSVLRSLLQDQLGVTAPVEL